MLKIRSQRSEVRGRRGGWRSARRLAVFAAGWGLLAAVGCPLSAAEELKVAYVNVGKLFDGYERTKASDANLEKKGKQKEGELKARMDDLEKLRQGLELLNDQAKEAKRREIEQKSDELQQFRNSTARDLRRERDAIAKDILKEIQRTIEDYAKANHVSLVLDERSLLYGQPTYDVTDDVLKLLNSRLAKPKP